MTYPEVKEEVGWQGMADGSIDTIVENWGHPDLVAKYIDDQGTVEDAGLTGNDGIIGWYVPPWLAEEHPDVLNWENLNKYAEEFSTSESGGKGQLLDGDPSYVTNDEALVKNLDLNFQVVVGGSEAALIQSFRSAEENKTWLLAYFYEPQWFFDEMDLQRVELPPYEEGCDADAAKVDCDYPPYALNKLIGTEFAESGSPRRGPDQELRVDQRGPEPRLEVHRRGRHGPRRRGAEVDRRQPRQGRRLVGVSRDLRVTSGKHGSPAALTAAGECDVPFQCFV